MLPHACVPSSALHLLGEVLAHAPHPMPLLSPLASGIPGRSSVYTMQAADPRLDSTLALATRSSRAAQSYIVVIVRVVAHDTWHSVCVGVNGAYATLSTVCTFGLGGYVRRVGAGDHFRALVAELVETLQTNALWIGEAEPEHRPLIPTPVRRTMPCDAMVAQPVRTPIGRFMCSCGLRPRRTQEAA